MKARRFGTRRRWRSTALAAQRLSLEQLELRYVLDGATLVGDVFDVGQNSPVSPLDVLANDQFDPGYTGAKRITSISFGSEGGSIDIADNGKTLRYAPPADYFGSELFTYVVDDQYTAQVHVRIQSPLAFDQYAVVPDGVERVFDVLANDPFWASYSGAKLITSVSTASASGEATISADGRSVRYTPPEGSDGGHDQFIYVVDGIYPARVNVWIAQTLTADQLELVQHTAGTFNLLSNDPFWTDYPGPRRITHVLDVDEGATAVIAPDGRSITYTPAPGANGVDNLRYVVDSAYETSATIYMHRPVRDDWFQTDQNSTSQSFNVIGNDWYRDLSGLERDVIERVTAVGQAESGGTVAISPDGLSVIYTPPAGFTGVDTFTYTADGVHRAEVRVQVTRPVRDDYIYQGVYQDTPDAALNVMANDFLGNGYEGARVITAVGPTAHGGTVRIASDGKRLIYTPVVGYVGPDSFTYTVDGSLDATVTLNVDALAQPDWYHFEADPTQGAYLLHVLSNDHFLKGYAGPGVITGVSDVAGTGSVTIVNGRALRFAPGATGATFSYTVDNKYTATVSFSIRNRLMSDLAVVDQNSGVATIDVLWNDFQRVYYPYVEYLGPRIITAVSDTAHGGTVTIAADGKSVQYQPPADFYGEDTFTYTVDGIMQTSVQVQVIRRVRDDQFRVDADAAAEALPVLVNDLFGADYRGGQVITAVSATSAGGSVSISADGRSVQYTPTAGFTGTDAFVYTVDGRLKAVATVLVGASHSDQFPTFGTTDDYAQFLIDDALARYEHLFGKASFLWEGLSPTTYLAADGAGRGHSETNVQVAGIDEGDIVEFDDDYAYVLNDSELVIVDAWPAESLSVASRYAVEGRPLVQFLSGNRLTIISETGGYPVGWDYLGGPMVDLRGGDAIWFPWYPPTPRTTIVTVLDVTDRTAPAVVQTTSMQGRYVDSRAIGDHVYVLVNNDHAVAPPPQLVPIADDGDPDTIDPMRYETREEYLARVTANQGELVEAALPNYTAYGPDGEVVRTGLLNDPASIYRPLVDGATNLISVVSFDVSSDEPGLASTAAVYTTGASVIYASLDNFYVFDQDHSREDGAQTRIVKFDWDPATGGVEFAAAGTVAGSILNQFSIDEHEGYVRIATTINNSGAGNWTGRSENTLFVLRDDGGVFEPVGSLQNLALDETIRSVRYMGDRALVTTARTIDPLFGLDLSDPTKPRAVGHLTLPGFSSYMQFIDDTHLLTVGENTPLGGGGPTQVALYDVSDLSRPVRIDEYTFARFSSSEAQVDHHAFGYFAVHGLLAIPTGRTYVVRVDGDGDGYRETRQTVREDQLAVLSIDVAAGASAISLAGEVAHGTAVRRSGYIGDYLYSIAGDSVKVVHVDDPNTIVGEASIAPLTPPETPVFPNYPFTPLAWEVNAVNEPATPKFPAAAPAALSSAAARAQAHLAGLLGRTAGASVVASAEATGDGATGGWRMVLGADSRQFLYYVRGEQVVLLANGSYQFAEEGAWHAIAAATAEPGDHSGDQRVDGGDLDVWRAAFGGDSAADSDGDGDSDGFDFLSWQVGLGGGSSRHAESAADVGGDFLAWQRNLGGDVAAAVSAPGEQAVDTALAGWAAENTGDQPSGRSLIRPRGRGVLTAAL